MIVIIFIWVEYYLNNPAISLLFSMALYVAIKLIINSFLMPDDNDEIEKEKVT